MSSSHEAVMAKGYKYYCMECNKVFKEIPTMSHETGHGRAIDVPSCPRDGCDLICNLSDNKLVKVGA